MDLRNDNVCAFGKAARQHRGVGHPAQGDDNDNDSHFIRQLRTLRSAGFACEKPASVAGAVQEGVWIAAWHHCSGAAAFGVLLVYCRFCSRQT
jgi:hypothetical protein